MFLGYPQVQKDFPLHSSPYFCLPSPLFMRDTSSRTTSHTEFEYNVHNTSVQAKDHTQKLNGNTHLPYYEILLAMCFSACDMQIKSCSSSASN